MHSVKLKVVLIMTLLPPSETVQKRIREQLYQDPSVTRDDIKHLREWISKQPHLPQEHEDIWIESVHYGCKYSLEKTKRVTENHYSSKTLLPYVFYNKDLSAISFGDISKIWYSFILPDYTPDGYRVFMIHLLEESQNNIIERVIKKFIHILFAYFYTETNLGFVFVMDLRGISMTLVAEFIPYLKHLLQFYEDSTALRIKQVHIISSSVVLKYVFSVIVPLLKEKLRKRIHIHTDDFTSLYDFIPREMLPSDYGGKGLNSSEYNDAWQNKIESMSDKIKAEINRRTDESKRPKGSVKKEYLGLEGSFKSLNID